ncbi:MAG TPA: hypothetical protein VFU81_20105 [Thermomicrobiales bacterium]|nr:hypothetical protein [Thermomicrobiales bacterium]
MARFGAGGEREGTRVAGGRDDVQHVELSQDATLVGVAVAGIISVVISEGAWDLFDSMVGLALLLVLLAYGKFRREVVRSPWEAIAVGAVFAFCIVLMVGPLIAAIPDWTHWPIAPAQPRQLEGFWFCVVWLPLAVAFALILHHAGERLLHRHRRRN